MSELALPIESVFSSIIQVENFWGPTPKNLGLTHATFGAISDNFRLRSRISPEGMKISKIRKICDRHQFLPRSAKTSGELCSTNNKIGHVSFDPPKSISSEDHNISFRKTIYIGPDGVRPAQIFTRAGEWPRLASARPMHQGRGPPIILNNKHLKIGLKFRELATILLGPAGVTSRIPGNTIHVYNLWGDQPPNRREVTPLGTKCWSSCVAFWDSFFSVSVDQRLPSFLSIDWSVREILRSKCRVVPGRTHCCFWMGKQPHKLSG